MGFYHDVFIVLLGAFGLAYLVGHSAISLPLRVALSGLPELRNDKGALLRSSVPGKLGPFGDFLCALLECPACFGFWEGVAIGGTLLVEPPGPISSVVGRVVWAVAFGCITSGSNFILGRLTRLI